MKQAFKICKNCGQEYKPCPPVHNIAFRWQDVACSKKCGMEYLSKIEISRGLSIEENSSNLPEQIPESIIENDVLVSIDEDEVDEFIFFPEIEEDEEDDVE